MAGPAGGMACGSPGTGSDAVYRPRSVVFLATYAEDGAAPVQEVRIEGPDGRTYLVPYPMQHQPDGRWLISDFYLFPVPGQSAALTQPTTATLSIRRVVPRFAATNTRVGRFATSTGSRVSASHIST